MIVGEQKPLDEIKAMIADYEKVLVVGCGTCVTVCFAGGEKEVGILVSSLRMATKLDGQNKEIIEATVQRQCEHEYNEEVAERIKEADVILSLACGIGVQTLTEQFPEKLTLPGLNTKACGDCVLAFTGGICPIARCSKSLLNGPCGGSQKGKCEIDPNIDCAWQLIYDRLKALDNLDLMLQIKPVKDWSTSRDGGPRHIIREDLRLEATS